MPKLFGSKRIAVTDACSSQQTIAIVIVKEKMSANRNKWPPYSRLSQHQKDRKNTNKRILRYKKGTAIDRLFPVGIEDQISAEENISSSLLTNDMQDDNHSNDRIFGQHRTPDIDNGGM